MNRAALLLVGMLSLAISGCTAARPRVMPAPPETKNIPSKSLDPAQLLNSLAQRAEHFRSLRALAAVYYWGEDGRGGFQEAILVHRPDRLRLETLSPLGAILIVTVDSDEVVGFHPREALLYRGKSSKENLFRYTQIPLELAELTSLLMGLPPFQNQGYWRGEGNSLYRQIGAGWREAVTFHPTLGVPVKWERSDPDGRVVLSAFFADFSSMSAGLFPLKITVEDHARQRRLEIRYQEPEVNVALPLALFVQEKPANVREIPLESLGG